MRYGLLSLLFWWSALSGCAVVAVTDAVVGTATTAVKAGASVVETAADLTVSGVKGVTGAKQ
ncbi:MAG: hypothetical protein HQM01_15045 [Magnetococcales bacterium]|nr:hypothetical protein [Magnetococcales bacterium]